MKASLNSRTAATQRTATMTAAQTSTFRYQAIDAKGVRITGSIHADNAALAKAALIKQGLRRIHLQQMRALPFRKQASAKDITLMYRTLAVLLSAGLTLTEALGIVADSADTRLSSLLKQIKSRIETGASFTDAIRVHYTTFDNLAVALIHAGEASGTLDGMLSRLAMHHETQSAIRLKLKKALQYPLLVIITAIIVMLILLIKVVPAFASAFSSMNQTLPLPTRIVIELADFVRIHWLWIIAVPLLMGGLMVYLWLKRADFRAKCASFSLTLPLFGALIQAAAVARFSRTLAMCIDAGVPLIEAIDLAGMASNHPTYTAAAHAIRADVLTGMTLQQAILKTRRFDMMSMQLIGAGERSGKLGQMLDKLADYHEISVAHRTESLLSFIEPAIILVLGLLVGGLVLAMYLPMLTLGMGN